jgi:hypothetical protein
MKDVNNLYKGRPCMAGIGKGEEIKSLNVVDVLTV